MNRAVTEGKVRYLGISNCFAWQLALANTIARENNLAGFVSEQNHYNLIFREEEREMMTYCSLEDIATTPYSALASGRLSRRPGEVTRRATEDSYAKKKYDSSEKVDDVVIGRVEEVASRLGFSMTDVAIAWLLTRVTSPVVGATKAEQVENAVKAPDITLSKEDIQYLEEAYVPHALVGVMADNVPKAAARRKDWSVSDPGTVKGR